jgi:hypothetical protein
MYLVYLLFPIIVYSQCNGIINGSICCDNICEDFCGLCSNDTLINAKCCLDVIMNSSIYCINNNMTAPCIIQINNNDSIISMILELLLNNLLYVILSFCGLLLLIVCFCYPKEKGPPISYELVINHID